MKRRQRGLQGAGRPQQPQPQPRALNHAPIDFERQVYLTAQEAADYLRFSSRCAQPVRAFRQWANRVLVPVQHAGLRNRVYRRADLDAAVTNPECFRCPR